MTSCRPGSRCGNIITGNFVQGALDDGIFVQGPQTIFDPGRPPLTLPGATGTVLRGNVALDNGHEVSSGFSQDGIHNDSPASTLTRNVANRNRNLGIESVAGATDGGGNRARENGNPLQCTGVPAGPDRHLRAARALGRLVT